LASGLSPLAAIVRRNDPDRFLTALFAPAERRETLLTLYAFNHELARAREVVSQPLLALMRLTWWREVVEGAQRHHEVATPLRAALDRGELDRAELLRLIDSREAEAEPSVPSLAAWRSYLMESAGGVMVAAGRLLGAPEPEALRPLGAAYGAAGVLRSVAVLAAQGRCLLPEDVLATHGLSPEAVVSEPQSAPLRAAKKELAQQGCALLDESRKLRLPRRAVAAVLPAVLARRDLTRIEAAPTRRGLGDRLAVMRAALTPWF
jgi:15-cis-phytoene synthase